MSTKPVSQWVSEWLRVTMAMLFIRTFQWEWHNCQCPLYGTIGSVCLCSQDWSSEKREREKGSLKAQRRKAQAEIHWSFTGVNVVLLWLLWRPFTLFGGRVGPRQWVHSLSRVRISLEISSRPIQWPFLALFLSLLMHPSLLSYCAHLLLWPVSDQ